MNRATMENSQEEILRKLVDMRRELARKQKKLEKCKRIARVKTHVRRKIQEHQKENEKLMKLGPEPASLFEAPVVSPTTFEHCNISGNVDDFKLQKNITGTQFSLPGFENSSKLRKNTLTTGECKSLDEEMCKIKPEQCSERCEDRTEQACLSLAAGHLNNGRVLSSGSEEDVIKSSQAPQCVDTYSRKGQNIEVLSSIDSNPLMITPFHTHDLGSQSYGCQANSVTDSEFFNILGIDKEREETCLAVQEKPEVSALTMQCKQQKLDVEVDETGCNGDIHMSDRYRLSQRCENNCLQESKIPNEQDRCNQNSDGLRKELVLLDQEYKRTTEAQLSLKSEEGKERVGLLKEITQTDSSMITEDLTERGSMKNKKTVESCGEIKKLENIACTIPDTELDSPEVPLEFTELDVIPYSQFELTEDFLSEGSHAVQPQKTENMRSLVKRCSPRLSSLDFNKGSSSVSGVQHSLYSQFSGANSEAEKIFRLPGVKRNRRRSHAQVRKAAAVLSIFQFLSDDARKLQSRSDFQLPESFDILKGRIINDEKNHVHFLNSGNNPETDTHDSCEFPDGGHKVGIALSSPAEARKYCDSITYSSTSVSDKRADSNSSDEAVEHYQQGNPSAKICADDDNQTEIFKTEIDGGRSIACSNSTNSIPEVTKNAHRSVKLKAHTSQLIAQGADSIRVVEDNMKSKPDEMDSQKVLSGQYAVISETMLETEPLNKSRTSMSKWDTDLHTSEKLKLSSCKDQSPLSPHCLNKAKSKCSMSQVKRVFEQDLMDNSLGIVTVQTDGENAKAHRHNVPVPLTDSEVRDVPNGNVSRSLGGKVNVQNMSVLLDQSSIVSEDAKNSSQLEAHFLQWSPSANISAIQNVNLSGVQSPSNLFTGTPSPKARSPVVSHLISFTSTPKPDKSLVPPDSLKAEFQLGSPLKVDTNGNDGCNSMDIGPQHFDLGNGASTSSKKCLETTLHQDSDIALPLSASASMDQSIVGGNTSANLSSLFQSEDSYVSPFQVPRNVSIGDSPCTQLEESVHQGETGRDECCPTNLVSHVTPWRKISRTGTTPVQVLEEKTSSSSRDHHGSFLYTPTSRRSRSKFISTPEGNDPTDKKLFKFSGCFQSCSQDAVVSLLCGEILCANGKTMQYIVSIQATSLTIWTEDDKDGWTTELDWRLSNETHVMKARLLPASDRVAVVASGVDGRQAFVTVFLYEWHTEATARYNLPLAEDHLKLRSPFPPVLCPVSVNELQLGITTDTHYTLRKVLFSKSLHTAENTCLFNLCRGHLLSLVPVSGLEFASIALTGDQTIAIWNMKLGVVLRTHKMPTSIPCLTSLLASRTVKGFIFMDLEWRVEGGTCGGGIVLNPFNGHVQQLHVLSTPNNTWKRVEAMTKENGCVLAVNDRGSVSVWDGPSGMLLGYTQSNITTCAAMLKSSERLVVGEIHGCLHLYSAVT